MSWKLGYSTIWGAGRSRFQHVFAGLRWQLAGRNGSWRWNPITARSVSQHCNISSIARRFAPSSPSTGSFLQAQRIQPRKRGQFGIKAWFRHGWCSVSAVHYRIFGTSNSTALASVISWFTASHFQHNHHSTTTHINNKKFCVTIWRAGGNAAKVKNMRAPRRSIFPILFFLRRKIHFTVN